MMKSFLTAASSLISESVSEILWMFSSWLIFLFGVLDKTILLNKGQKPDTGSISIDHIDKLLQLVERLFSICSLGLGMILTGLGIYSIYKKAKKG